MPQFEIEPAGERPRLVRARSALDAVRPPDRASTDGIEVGDAEAGTGWCAVTIEGEAWGRVRARDRMRFRRD